LLVSENLALPAFRESIIQDVESLCKYKAMREQPRNVYRYRGSYEPNCYASESPGDQSEGEILPARTVD